MRRCALASIQQTLKGKRATRRSSASCVMSVYLTHFEQDRPKIVGSGSKSDVPKHGNGKGPAEGGGQPVGPWADEAERTLQSTLDSSNHATEPASRACRVLFRGVPL